MAEVEKPTSLEDEYFAREDIEKKRKLAFEQAEKVAAQQREELKRLHHMKCPKCGMDLHALHKGDVELDTCFHCKGVWLDEGELARLVKQGEAPGGHKVIQAVLNIFKRS